MDKKPARSGDPLNAAIARVLRDAQEAIPITDVALAKKAGLDVQRLRRIMKDERAMGATPFLRIVAALSLDPTDVTSRAQAALSEELADG